MCCIQFEKGEERRGLYIRIFQRSSLEKGREDSQIHIYSQSNFYRCIAGLWFINL